MALMKAFLFTIITKQKHKGQIHYMNAQHLLANSRLCIHKTSKSLKKTFLSLLTVKGGTQIVKRLLYLSNGFNYSLNSVWFRNKSTVCYRMNYLPLKLTVFTGNLKYYVRFVTAEDPLLIARPPRQFPQVDNMHHIYTFLGNCCGTIVLNDLIRVKNDSKIEFLLNLSDMGPWFEQIMWLRCWAG